MARRVLIPGIGNGLQTDGRLPDGGRQGRYLLPVPEDCDALPVFEAIDDGHLPKVALISAGPTRPGALTAGAARGACSRPATRGAIWKRRMWR